MPKIAIATLVLALLFTAPLAAETPAQVPRSREEIALSFAPIVKQVAPAVVNIYTRQMVQQRSMHPLMNDPFFQQFFGGQMQGLTRERVQASLGSGVIIRPDGLVVTNNHVVKEADQIRVVLSDRREYEATVFTSDAHSDLAFLKLKTKAGETFPTLALKDSDEVDVGDLVLAIGNPFGVGQTVTMGIVSAIARSAVGSNSDVNYFIQTDAAINPGNSGGALVSVDGKLVGIPSSIYSRDGGSLGIGFATPSNLVKAVLASAGEGGRIVRGWLGFDGDTLTAELAKGLNIERPSGVIIKSLHTASPARAAGLKAGDIILSVNGHDVPDAEALRFRIATSAVGSELALKVSRNGEVKDYTVKLIAPPENPSRDETVLTGEQPLQGAKIVNLSPAVAQEFSLPDSEGGVLIIDVAANSAAQLMGLRRGDIVTAINGKNVTNVEALKKMMAPTAGVWRITINRGGNVATLAVRT